MIHRISRVALSSLALWLSVLGCVGIDDEDVGSDIAWPGETWMKSTPEEQGMSSGPLMAMLEHVQNEHVDSIHVVRNGYLVLEAYRYPYSEEYRHIIHSCTKSIISTLVGLAIDDGYLKGVGDKVSEVFSGPRYGSEEADISKLTLEHLLTMTTGLESRDSYLYGWEGLSAMRASPDWTAFALTRPKEAPPGRRFDYSNMASFLLSAVVQTRIGRSAEEYARERVFDPIGVGEVEWPLSPEGVNIGWGELRMYPGDLARFGLLFLRDGVWDGRRIVPSRWIRTATRRHVRAGTLREYYGYQWWIDPSGPYMALGYAGQYLIVDVEHDLVVAITSTLSDNQFYLPWRLYTDYILPAVEVVGEQQQSPDRLAAMVADLAQGPEARILDRDPREPGIHGVRYDLEENPFRMTGLTLFFGEQEALVREHYANRVLDYRTGIDGRFVLNELDDQGTVAVRGRWLESGAYEVEYYSIGGAWRTLLLLDYDGERLVCRATTGSRDGIRFSGEAVAE